LGISDLGESRPQELWRKSELIPPGARWHLIGPLQRNKARRTLPLADLIHSVDSVPLLERLDELAIELELERAVLLEVNVSGEPAKHGFHPQEMPRVLAAADKLERVEIRGLMTMAPYDADPQSARPVFARLRQLRDELKPVAPPRCSLSELSMGMSGDFEVAIAEGATIVRIGSALFHGVEDEA
jgi:pyridoxal phosphate enzyme (YggS family)